MLSQTRARTDHTTLPHLYSDKQNHSKRLATAEGSTDSDSIPIGPQDAASGTSGTVGFYIAHRNASPLTAD